MEQRDERIVVETLRHRITGSVSLPVDGYRSRLTDYLNSSEREFVALTDVTIASLDGGRGVERCEFLALALAQVIYARPANAED